MKRWWILKGIKIAIMVLIFITAMSYVVMMLWNWLMPAVFSLGMITFWQALGILVLAKVLFGFGRSGWGHHGHHHWKHGEASMWKAKMKEKLEGMTPEERDKLRAEWRRRCGWRYSEEEEEKKSDSTTI